MKLIHKLSLACVLTFASIAANAGTFVGERSDFRDETVYFAMTTRFYDGDPSNNVLCWDNQAAQIADRDPAWRGDFKGLIDKLDYIKALGFTAIWITPVVQNCSGYDYHGYHAMDFSTVDLRYESHVSQGSSEDVTFQSLIDAAHAKGMKIILDIVLNHTGNFGEAHFCKLFDRDPTLRNQATPEGALVPDASKLGSDYNEQSGSTQHQRRLQWLKNTGGQNLDTHNYWHHIGTSWNWDEPSRWWGQIAGDCVDLNTENQAVSDYLVECYGKFIAMGVDGFRIDTTGHISRLTFNKSFIPQFLALAEQYKSKRLNECPFYMFGECCARFSEVTYRGHANLSSYYYTWQSPRESLDAWNSDASWWDAQTLMEGCDPVGNMLLCLQEPDRVGTSDNALMKNGAWHEPDYSQASGFNIIDFPMHYNFSNASSAINIAKSGDKYYNDASYNLVYVDSHDYGPQPNDRVRFNGGTAQWAENLALMFTFRGIPCIYYGSEVEFQKGKIIDDGPNCPLKETGRAYFGHYLEGQVTASDFGQYTASGNVAETLNGDLAQHIVRLNQIRAAVPALRKGQYTFDGCSARGGWAFKRAYRDSYALVALNGGATFSNVPDGNYVDLVTGKTFTPANGSITVDAPATKGQLRVLVKDWDGGKVGDDGKFIYTTAPVAHGGNPSFDDPGASFWYGPDDVVAKPQVVLSPAGGTFKTETLTVTASLSESAISGWLKVGGDDAISLAPGQDVEFAIGADMQYGDRVDVTWCATGENDTEYKGSTFYKKADPNATITIYVTSTQGPNFYAWYKDATGANIEPNGSWPGRKLTDTKEIEGRDFYYYTFDDAESVNFIFNSNGSAQTADITGVTEDSYYEWDGSSGYTQIYEFGDTPQPDKTDVTIYFDNAKSNWSAVNLYIYGSSSGEQLAGPWPGKPMAIDPATGYYYYTFSTALD
nr:starch-binding protein [Muribaculaceae bacterium]